jgi:hypothetical protein
LLVGTYTSYARAIGLGATHPIKITPAREELMQAKCAAILLGGVVLAGSMMTSGFAQNVPYFEVGEINVKDQKGYEASGVGKVRETQEAVGCKLIAGGYDKAQDRQAAREPFPSHSLPG